MLGTMVLCKRLPLDLPDSERSSQDILIIDSCQQALLRICNCVWVLVSMYGMDLQVRQSLDGLSFSLCSTLCLCISSYDYFAPPYYGLKYPHFGQFLAVPPRRQLY